MREFMKLMKSPSVRVEVDEVGEDAARVDEVDEVDDQRP